ncbi:MAG: transcriptional regulator with XRE-family HTH domain [Flavobacteriales bacterium]
MKQLNNAGLKNIAVGEKIKELRKQNGISQELLAEKAGVSARTVQRIENGATQPTGDSIQKLAVALAVTPNELMDWQMLKDTKVLLLLNLSQLGFIPFPLLGTVIPMIIWISKKDKIQHVDSIGKAILNFQISWSLLLFFMLMVLFGIDALKLPIDVSFASILITIGGMYFLNFVVVLFNTLRYHNGKPVRYKPAFLFLS